MLYKTLEKNKNSRPPNIIVENTRYPLLVRIIQFRYFIAIISSLSNS